MKIIKNRKTRNFLLLLTIWCSLLIGGALYSIVAFSGTQDHLQSQENDLKTSELVKDYNGVPICNGNYYYDVISDGSGGFYIVWEEKRGDSYDIYAQRVNQSGHILWDSGGVVVCNASGDQIHSVVTSDGVGGIIIAWTDDYRIYYSEVVFSQRLNVYAQRLNPLGEILWNQNGTLVSGQENYNYRPSIASDGLGGAIISYIDTSRLDTYDIRVQRIDSEGNSQWNPEGVAMNTSLDLNNYGKPKIISDNSVETFVVWDDGHYPSGLFIQKINSTGYVQWISGGICICNTTNDFPDPQIIYDEFGCVIVAWEHEDEVTHESEAYMQRITSSGQFNWGVNGTQISPENKSAHNVRIVSDDSGGVIISWGGDRRYYLTGGVFTQRFDYSGEKIWTSDEEIDVCINEDYMVSMFFSDIQSCSDANGGEFIVWEDYRDDDNLYTNADLYCQKIDSSGDVKWTINGLAVCKNSYNQQCPQILSDNMGGVIIIWRDYGRIDEINIFAQRINSEGQKLWFSYKERSAIPGLDLTLMSSIIVISFLSISIILMKNKRFRKM